VSGQRFSDQEVAALLQRTAELQAEGSGGRGMTLEEVERIAAEAGLDAALVRRAASELRRPGGAARTSGWLRKLLGGPAKLRWEIEVDGEIDEAAHEAILEAIHMSISEPGTTSTAGRTLQWSFVSQSRKVLVSVSPRNGRTVIRVEEGMGNMIGGIYGGVLGGVGGTLAPLAGIGGAALLGATGALAGIFVALGATYVGTRAIYNKVTDSREQALAGLVDEVRAAVEASVEGPTQPLSTLDGDSALADARERQGVIDAPTRDDLPAKQAEMRVVKDVAEKKA
jgi:hypothetical protein